MYSNNNVNRYRSGSPTYPNNYHHRGNFSGINPPANAINYNSCYRHRGPVPRVSLPIDSRFCPGSVLQAHPMNGFNTPAHTLKSQNGASFVAPTDTFTNCDEPQQNFAYNYPPIFPPPGQWPPTYGFRPSFNGGPPGNFFGNQHIGTPGYPGEGGYPFGYPDRGRGKQQFWNAGAKRKRDFDDNGNNWGQRKPEKMNKRDRPENNRFICDTCDRGFKTEDKFKEHCDQHQKCNVPGCSYVAAAKLVKLHYEWQHKSGLAKKIWCLESKDDIEKWRAERRKNFPTEENMIKKQKLAEEKKDRGELLETKTFGKFGRNHNGRGRRRKGRCWQNWKNVDEKQLNEQTANTLVKSEIEKECCITTSSDLAGPKPESDVIGQGTSAKVSDKHEIENVANIEPNKVVKDYQVDQNNTMKENRLTESSRNCNLKIPFTKQDKIVSQRQLSLLEKLLAPDIRHERNVILQCVKYIVKNNFFTYSKV